MKISSAATSTLLLFHSAHANLRKVKSFAKDEASGINFDVAVSITESGLQDDVDLLESETCAPYLEGLEWGIEQLLSMSMDHIKDWVCAPNQLKDAVNLLSSLGFGDGMIQDDVEISVEDSNAGEVFAAIGWGSDTASPTAKPTPSPVTTPASGRGIADLVTEAKNAKAQAEELAQEAVDLAQEYASVKAQFTLCLWNCGGLEEQLKEVEAKLEQARQEGMELKDKASKTLATAKDMASKLSVSDMTKCSASLKDMMKVGVGSSNGVVQNAFSSESECRAGLDEAFSELQEKGILEKHDGGVLPSVRGGTIQERRLILGMILMALFQELIKALAPFIIIGLIVFFLYVLYLAATDPMFWLAVV